MSKIFEAIQKGSGGASDILPALLKDQSPPVMRPFVPDSSLENNAPASHESVLHAAAGIPLLERTLPLQIQSDAPVLIFDQPKNRAGEQYRILRCSATIRSPG